MCTSVTNGLVNDKINPFKSVSAASSFFKTNPSTIKTLLNTKIANSKGYYFFDHPISDDLKKELLLKPNVRDSISKLRIKTWVSDFNLNLINNRPFCSLPARASKAALERYVENFTFKKGENN